HTSPGGTYLWIFGVGILRIWLFAQASCIMNGCDQLQRGTLRHSCINVVFADDHIFESLFPPLVRHIIRQIVVPLRSCKMRLRSEDTVLFAFFFRGGDCLEFLLELILFGGMSTREPQDRATRIILRLD